MARPQKLGLEYFPLDVEMDDNFKLIEAEHGITGFGILIKMYQKIYSEGYFYPWTEKEQLLFSQKVYVVRNTITSVISDGIKWGIFSKELFEKYSILTSKGIQKRYISAIYKRTDSEMIKEYLLIDVSDKKYIKTCTIDGVSDRNNEAVIMVSDVRNEDVSNVSDDKSTQSKVKKSKVNNKNICCAFFESIWKLYPNKKGKGQVSDTQKAKLYKIGFDELSRCIDRYRHSKPNWQQWQNGSTFFNSGYVDYLDCNCSGNDSPDDTPGIGTEVILE